ncbi:MAG TPA: hypothetical protein PLB62_14545 [Candidatus Sumerlaeota bacterium]|nr:hypothetical protein [Candidatus Sumerlaeota bacterium]
MTDKPVRHIRQMYFLLVLLLILQAAALAWYCHGTGGASITQDAVCPAGGGPVTNPAGYLITGAAGEPCGGVSIAPTGHRIHHFYTVPPAPLPSGISAR